jgi:hypothetical protein
MTQLELLEKLLDLGVAEHVAQVVSAVPTEGQRKAVWNAITKIRLLENLRILEMLKEDALATINTYAQQLRNAAEKDFT